MARHKVHERRLARESALALLYSSDITEQEVSQIVESGAYPADDVDLPEYAEALILGVAEHREDIDAQLEDLLLLNLLGQIFSQGLQQLHFDVDIPADAVGPEHLPEIITFSGKKA